jgi:hypothetical protein
MRLESTGPALPENLGDTVEYSGKEEYYNGHIYSLEAIKRKCGYGKKEAIFS